MAESPYDDAEPKTLRHDWRVTYRLAGKLRTVTIETYQPLRRGHVLRPSDLPECHGHTVVIRDVIRQPDTQHAGEAEAELLPPWPRAS